MLTGQFGDSKINNNILVTGASGFVGSALYRRLLRDGRNVFGLARSLNEEDKKFIKGDILSVRETDLSRCQPGVVIHCAGLTKSPAKAAHDKKSQLHAVNVEGALNVARQASLLKCRRFIFMSSVKVNGEETASGQPFTLHDPPAPLDAYGKSKWEAEQRLIDFTRQKGIELVIIRSPLIYGPQVKGNFAALAKLVDLGIPLPLAKIKNKRSLIGINNLVDLISTCIDHPNAANQVFFASDDQDLSTPELLCGMAKAMERSSMLFRCPPNVLFGAALIIRKAGLAEKLLGSLQVDISETKHLLGWAPTVSVEEGLRRCFQKT
jgi:nucleoside-diphosphate-sugar epimerase